MAEFAGAARGYAYAGRYRARPAYRLSLEDAVHVESGFEGRSPGGALLASLLARC